MYESPHGRLARVFVVLLGVALWWPVLGPELSQPTCAEAGGSPVGEFDAEEAPSETREAEDPEGSNHDRGLGDLQSVAPRLRLSAVGPIRLGVPKYERERLADAHHALARERGPPIV